VVRFQRELSTLYRKFGSIFSPGGLAGTAFTEQAADYNGQYLYFF